MGTTLNQSLDFLSGLRGWDIRISPRFLTYAPTYKIYIETNQYILRTAETLEELMQLFELRYDCFLRDHYQELRNDGFDLDSFDSLCDHLAIIDRTSKKIIGTYRILTDTMTKHFYSQNEFDLGQFPKLQGKKMELGRACISLAHRNGHVIDLLWKGICQFVQQTNSRYLFGCSSVTTTSPQKSEKLMAYFQELGALDSSLNIRPTEKYHMNLKSTLPTLSPQDFEECKRLTPPLLRSYINAGAKIYGQPALDKEFNCIDFLTILDLEKMSGAFRRRYFRNENLN